MLVIAVGVSTMGSPKRALLHCFLSNMGELIDTTGHQPPAATVGDCVTLF